MALHGKVGEVQPSLGFPLAALPAFIGTIRPSGCLRLICPPSLVVGHTTYALLAPHLPDMEATGSPQLAQHHCTT